MRGIMKKKYATKLEESTIDEINEMSKKTGSKKSFIVEKALSQGMFILKNPKALDIDAYLKENH